MHYDVQTLEHQQEFETPEMSSRDDEKSLIENVIVGYNEALDQYALKSAGEIKYVDSS
jgi:hypothetical protein